MSDSSTAFNFNQMIAGLQQYTQAVKSYISALEKSAQSGSVDLATMFTLQFHMQILSQYTEAVSNILSAVHNEMITMARATKGQ